MKESDIRTIKRLADIKAALTARAMTVNELAEAIHINAWSAGFYMRNLHGNRVYIESWNYVPSRIVAVYRWSNLPDAPKPPAKTPVECERNRIARIKKNPEAHDRYLSYHRGRTAAKKAVKKPNTWASSLFSGPRAIQQGGRT